MAIHLQTKVSRIAGGSFLEDIDVAAFDVIGQLERGAGLPVGGNAFEVERGEFALQPVLEGEVELR